MAELSSIPRVAMEMIGKEFVRLLIFEVEKEAVRRFVEAIEDPNPLYQEEEYAKESPHGAILAPPLMLGIIGFPQLQESQLGLLLDDKRNPIGRYINYEFLHPVKVGDTISINCRLDDLQEEESRLGPMITIFTTRVFTNQNGEVVCIEKAAVSRY